MNPFIYDAVEALRFPVGTRREKFKIIFNCINYLNWKEFKRLCKDDQTDFLAHPIEIQKKIIDESVIFNHDIQSGAIVFRLISCVTFTLDNPRVPYFLMGYTLFSLSHNYSIALHLNFIRDLIKKGILPGGEICLHYLVELWNKSMTFHIYAAVPYGFEKKKSLSYVLSDKSPSQS